jgi:hypothetical protein
MPRISSRGAASEAVPGAVSADGFVVLKLPFAYAGTLIEPFSIPAISFLAFAFTEAERTYPGLYWIFSPPFLSVIV